MVKRDLSLIKFSDNGVHGTHDYTHPGSGVAMHLATLAMENHIMRAVGAVSIGIINSTRLLTQDTFSYAALSIISRFLFNKYVTSVYCRSRVILFKSSQGRSIK